MMPTESAIGARWLELMRTPDDTRPYSPVHQQARREVAQESIRQALAFLCVALERPDLLDTAIFEADAALRPAVRIVCDKSLAP